MNTAEPLLAALSQGTTLNGRTRQRLRAYPLIVDGKERKAVACDKCGNQFAIAERTMRERRQLGRPLECDNCQRPVDVAPTEKTRCYWDRQWALGHITLQEALEISEGIWGPRTEWA